MKNKVSEIKISYKEKVSTLNSPKITCSKDTAELLFKHWNKDTIELQETFKILLLNNSSCPQEALQVHWSIYESCLR